MGRWPTWLLVGALAALGAVAVADALRGAGERRRVRSPTITAPLIARNEPPSNALGGVLYYSDIDDDCRLDGLTLPELRQAPPPKLLSCRFSLSPDGQSALPDEAEWSPEGGFYARQTGRLIELGSPDSSQLLRFPGRVPAFKPDGTLTYVRGNDVVEWTTSCPRGTRLFTLPGDNATARCREVVLTTDRLKRILPPDAVRGPLLVKDLAWLSESRLVAVVGVDAGTVGYRELVPVLQDGRVVGGTMHAFADGLRIEASPRGSFFAAWYGDSLVSVRDREGREIVFPPVPSVHALAWSPDERWTTIATEHSVYVFRTNEGEARVRRLPIVARDLAWR